MTWQYLVLTRPSTCLCARASHLQFPLRIKGNMFHEFFEQTMSQKYKQLIHMSQPDLSIFHRNIWIWKKFSLLACFTKWKYLSNNDYSSVIKTNWKMWSRGEEQLQGEQETQPSCGRLWDEDWDNIMRVSKPFPLSFFDCYFLIHVWSFPCFMDQASWNFCNLLPFTDEKMIFIRQHEKHSTGIPNTNTQKGE